MIFQFSFSSYKSLETREYFSRRDKNLLDLLMIPRNDPLRKEKKNLRPDFKFFDCSNPPPPPPPPPSTNRVISRSVVVFLWPGGQKVRSRVSNEKDT